MLTISVCTEINYDLQVIYTSNLLNILEKLEIENKYLSITRIVLEEIYVPDEVWGRDYNVYLIETFSFIVNTSRKWKHVMPCIYTTM